MHQPEIQIFFETFDTLFEFDFRWFLLCFFVFYYILFLNFAAN